MAVLAILTLAVLPSSYGAMEEKGASVIHSLPRLPPSYPPHGYPVPTPYPHHSYPTHTPYPHHGYPTPTPYPHHEYTPTYHTHGEYSHHLAEQGAFFPEGYQKEPHLPPHEYVVGEYDAPVVLTHHHLAEYQPYHYDSSKTPDCALTNKQYYNLTFCLQDQHYPVDTVKYELERNKPLVDRILTDITYQSADNLVDGLTKEQEEGYNYQHYYGQQKLQEYTEDYSGYSYYQDYHKGGGYACPSDIFYGRPKRAVNTYGKWKVIVNLPDKYYEAGYGAGYEKYTQTQRLEQCMYPQAPCSYIEPTIQSSCLQKYNYVRLLAYSYEEGLHIDSFKLPISCSCHLTRPRNYGQYPAFLPAIPPQQYPPYSRQ